jgi:hypothetical protein
MPTGVILSHYKVVGPLKTGSFSNDPAQGEAVQGAGESEMISVVHIGLPLAPPWVPAEECEKIASRLIGLRQKMEGAGYRYEVMHASPEGGLAELRKRLQSEPCDAVLIGGGVVADEKLAVFKQQIIEVTRDEAPGTKVLEFDHAVDVQTLLELAFSI